MKRITFENKTASKIYEDYIRRIERMTTSLSAEDRNDILMEFNSHIYESLQQPTNETETDRLLAILQNLGAPEQVLLPMVARRKLNQATKTFNPVHVFKALALNITNGISYLIFSILYLMLFAFIFLIGAKLFDPKRVGMFYKESRFFYFGYNTTAATENPNVNEMLGNWFIPVMLLTVIVLYFAITFGLRLKRQYLK